jgi:oligosaccharide repeat unit polymerase
MLPITMILFCIFNFFHRSIDALFCFINIHLISLILYLLYQSKYLQEMSLGFYIQYILLLLGFFMGYKLIANKQVMHSNIFLNKITVIISNSKLRKINIINNIAFFIFLIAYCYELSVAGFIPPILAADKSVAYTQFPQEFIHYFVVSGITISISLAFIAAISLENRKINLVLISIIFILLVSTLARAIFMVQLFGVGATFFKLGYGPKKIKMKHLALMFVLLLTFVYVLGGIRVDAGNWNMIIEIGQMDWPGWSAPFAWIYLYLTTSIENLRFGVENLNSHTYGLITLGTIPLTIFNRSAIKEFQQDNVSNFLNSDGFNTAGLFAAVMQDFGELGILYTFVLGILTVLILSSKKLYLILFSPIWLYSLLTSVTNDYFSQFFLLIYFVFLLIVDTFSGPSIKISKYEKEVSAQGQSLLKP